LGALLQALGAAGRGTDLLLNDRGSRDRELFKTAREIQTPSAYSV
jgi:hypothetical protein